MLYAAVPTRNVALKQNIYIKTRKVETRFTMSECLCCLFTSTLRLCESLVLKYISNKYLKCPVLCNLVWNELLMFYDKSYFSSKLPSKHSSEMGSSYTFLRRYLVPQHEVEPTSYSDSINQTLSCRPFPWAIN